MRKVAKKTKAKGERQREWPKPQELGPDIKANSRRNPRHQTDKEPS